MIKIITPEQRLSAPKKTNIALFGPSGSGKTYQARTLDPKKTLFIDLEAGTLALGEWPGQTLDVRKISMELGAHPWEVCRALACLISGPDFSDPQGPYGDIAYKSYAEKILPAAFLEQYDTFFWDSITVASRHSFSWAQKQPQAFSEKTGKPDNRGAYGLHGIELIRWITQIQHGPKSTVIVGILNREKDDLNRITWEPQMEGSKAGRELPGIFDQVLTLQEFSAADGQPYRAFVCQKINPWGYPAKDRSGCLDIQEPPDLAKLMKKIAAGKRIDSQAKVTIPEIKSEEQKINSEQVSFDRKEDKK